jgi:hypothetical protein
MELIRTVHRSTKATLDARQVDVERWNIHWWRRILPRKSINTSNSINWEANACLLRRAAQAYNLHATRTLMPRGQHIPHIIYPSQPANTPKASRNR